MPESPLHFEELRRIIDVAGILDALERCARGDNPMTAAQLTAAQTLLRKTLPDLPTGLLLRAAGEAEKGVTFEDALLELQ